MIQCSKFFVHDGTECVKHFSPIYSWPLFFEKASNPYRYVRIHFFFFFFRFLCPAVILSFLVDTIENILDKSAISYREGDRFRIEKIDRSSNPIQIQLRLR